MRFFRYFYVLLRFEDVTFYRRLRFTIKFLTVTVEEYNKCVDRYADCLYRFALKTLKQTEDARDIVQESFEKLWINRKKVEPEKAKSYLFTVAYHEMIDEIRKNKRTDNSDTVLDRNELCYCNYSDLNELLHKIMEKLPEIQRSVLLLRDYEGYSYEEIGKITDLGESQVKVYIYRARRQMRQFIGSLEVIK